MTLQRATVATDDVGVPVKTWADLFTTWCEYLPLSVLETIQSGETVAERSIRLRIRYREGLLPVDRVVFPAGKSDALTYDVVGIDHPDRDRYCVITARARADGPDDAP